LTVEDIQGLLFGDEALALFVSGDKETYVFAVTRLGRSPINARRSLVARVDLQLTTLASQEID
jgi:hypothetical protein